MQDKNLRGTNEVVNFLALYKLSMQVVNALILRLFWNTSNFPRVCSLCDVTNFTALWASFRCPYSLLHPLQFRFLILWFLQSMGGVLGNSKKFEQHFGFYIDRQLSPILSGNSGIELIVLSCNWKPVLPHQVQWIPSLPKSRTSKLYICMLDCMCSYTTEHFHRRKLWAGIGSWADQSSQSRWPGPCVQSDDNRLHQLLVLHRIHSSRSGLNHRCRQPNVSNKSSGCAGSELSIHFPHRQSHNWPRPQYHEDSDQCWAHCFKLCCHC